MTAATIVSAAQASAAGRVKNPRTNKIATSIDPSCVNFETASKCTDVNTISRAAAPRRIRMATPGSPAGNIEEEVLTTIA
jgi:hypothetical protein